MIKKIFWQHTEEEYVSREIIVDCTSAMVVISLLCEKKVVKSWLLWITLWILLHDCVSGWRFIKRSYREKQSEVWILNKVIMQRCHVGDLRHLQFTHQTHSTTKRSTTHPKNDCDINWRISTIVYTVLEYVWNVGLFYYWTPFSYCLVPGCLASPNMSPTQCQTGDRNYTCLKHSCVLVWRVLAHNV